ncbi:MAG TPA: endonuclease/exonuclease/phosphatase family protein [Ferruginibacter sp.]|nr:endonuclease/exonuclease/phosphatase family protein [Ferruginibacter sp.]HPH90147.1 endonuclease/exonuclease/phosphatase family protein [Ferruginibacter sp.]
MPKSLFRRLSKKFFIISNSIVAVLFVLGCYGKLFFTFGWPFGLLPLASFYLLILLILFIVFWLFVKWGWSLISLVAILICIKPFAQVVPYRLSSSFDEVANAEDIRVMSWNVAQFDLLYAKKRPEKRDDMMALINKYKPDIACFQEMVAADTLVNLDNPYYRRYSFISVFEYAEKLHYPHYFFSYDFRQDFLNRQHFGTIIFSRYPIINRQRFTFAPYNYNSDFQYADIVRETDTIRVFNIHLQSLKFTDGSRAFIEDPSLESKQDIKRSKTVIVKFKQGLLLRQQQVDRIKEEIDKSPYPVILCGDFNDVPNSYAYQTIGENLQNTFAEKGSGLGRTYTSIAPTLRIDNIFVSDSFTVNQFVRLPVKLSDHYPIIADLGKKRND